MFARTAPTFQSLLINHYERLGLKLALPAGLAQGVEEAKPNDDSELVFRYSDFSDAQIKAAYRRRALQCHPDVAVDHEKVSAESEFRRVSESFAILQDATRRKEIDETLQKHFEQRITKQHGGQVVYHARKAIHKSTAAPLYAYPSGRANHAEKVAQHAKRAGVKVPFGSQETFTEGKSWKDVDNNIWSSNPVGTGVPAYEHYLKGVELEENQSVSSYTSMWVKSTELQSPRSQPKSASATSSRRKATSAKAQSAPFLRKDADQAFKTAFDGKSWDEVLFQMRYQSRYGNSSKTIVQPDIDHKPEGQASTNSTHYKLQSPGLRGAEAMRVDNEILRSRIDNYQKQGGSSNNLRNANAQRDVTITDKSSNAVAQAHSIRTSPIYSKMAEYANAAYLRQELASTWEPKSVADGGPIHFPHVAAEQKVEGNVSADPTLLRRSTLAAFNKHRQQAFGMRYRHLTRGTETRNEALLHLKRQKEEIGYNDGQLYSYHRPY